MHYFYGHYYAVQAMWTAGGDTGRMVSRHPRRIGRAASWPTAPGPTALQPLRHGHGLHHPPGAEQLPAHPAERCHHVRFAAVPRRGSALPRGRRTKLTIALLCLLLAAVHLAADSDRQRLHRRDASGKSRSRPAARAGRPDWSIRRWRRARGRQRRAHGRRDRRPAAAASPSGEHVIFANGDRLPRDRRARC